MDVAERTKENAGQFAILYDDETEKKLHKNAIEMLAMRIGVPIDDVERVYEIVLKRFKKRARIKDFLPVLVSRRVEYLISVRRNRGIL